MPRTVACASLGFLFITTSVLAAEPPTPEATETAAPAETEATERVDLNDLLNMKVEVTSRRPETIFDTPSNVIVIDRRTIDLYGFRTVAEALDTVSGVLVMRTYFKRDIPTIRGVLQEQYADKVLVLINGVPAWMATTGEGSIDRLDMKDIDRIEVLKGPASVVYGTNAYAGAINLVLRTSLADKGEVYGRVGSAYMVQGGGHYNVAFGNFTLSGFANGGDDRGTNYHFKDESGATGNVKDFVKQNNVSLVGEYAGEHSTHTVLFNGFSNTESYLGVTPLYSQGVGLPQYLGGYLASYKYKYSVETLDVEAGLAFDYQWRNYARLAGDTQRTNTSGERVTPFVRALYRPAKWIDLELGVDTDFRFSNELNVYDTRSLAVIADNNMKGLFIRESSVFGQVKFNAGVLAPSFPFTFLVGVRYTNNSLFAGNTSFRATINYRITETQSLKLIGAQSFRAPTFYELYFQTPTNTVYGNTSLKPETSNSLELTYLLGVEKFFGTATAYIASYDNKIFRENRNLTPGDTSQIYVNGNQVIAKGYELDAKYQNPLIINAFVGFSYVDGNSGDQINGNGHYNFRYVPKAMVSAGLSRAIGPFSLGATVKYLGTQRTQTSTLAPQAVLNANIGYRWGRTFHRVVLENAFNNPLLFPEYVRGNLDGIQSGYGRRIYYSFQYEFL